MPPSLLPPEDDGSDDADDFLLDIVVVLFKEVADRAGRSINELSRNNNSVS